MSNFPNSFLYNQNGIYKIVLNFEDENNCNNNENNGNNINNNNGNENGDLNNNENKK